MKIHLLSFFSSLVLLAAVQISGEVWLASFASTQAFYVSISVSVSIYILWIMLHGSIITILIWDLLVSLGNHVMALISWVPTRLRNHILHSKNDLCFELPLPFSSA